jgi:hypothetical protein
MLMGHARTIPASLPAQVQPLPLALLNGRVTDENGTGLKDATVRMGGDLTVESKFGKGSMFTVTLPTVASANAQS